MSKRSKVWRLEVKCTPLVDRVWCLYEHAHVTTWRNHIVDDDVISEHREYNLTKSSARRLRRLLGLCRDNISVHYSDRVATVSYHFGVEETKSLEYVDWRPIRRYRP